MEKELVCIGCPIGCRLSVSLNGEGEYTVRGNTCERGEAYAKKELTNPTRIVTSVVRVKGGRHKVVPVKTKGDIPKAKIMECMKLLKETEVEAPVRLGDVIVKNAAGTGVDVVATKSV